MITKTDALGRRAWTMKEVHWLRANYAALGPGLCAERLERTRGAVIQQGMQHGISKRKTKREQVEATIRQLHAAGKNDEEIGRELGWTKCGRERVRYWRKLFGLPANEQPGEKSAEYGRRGMKAACLNNGTHSLIEVRWQEERIEAARRGWYGAENLTQVKILETLRDSGPATARQIVERNGWRWCVGRYHSVRGQLAHLIAVGLVVARRGSQVQYSLSIGRIQPAGKEESLCG